MSKTIPGMLKDENGMFVKVEKALEKKPVPEPDASIDDMLKQGMTLIQRSLKTLGALITAGEVDRETIGCLKDCMTMLHELKKKEQELLNSMSDEELEKEINKVLKEKK